MPVSTLAYCGAPPLPDNLWVRWNLDPVLIAALIAVLLGYLWDSRGSLRQSERSSFVAGWGVAAVALVSPLCALSVSLFAARLSQHMILTLVAAPLIALGRPWTGLAGLLPENWRILAHRKIQIGQGVGAAALGFALLLWFWHAPGPYAATFLSTGVYWAMHLSLFFSAVWLWSGLLCNGAAEWRRLLAGIATSLQMGLLGAVITLAPQLLYDPHRFTAQLWGFTPLEDQQLGGLIMWVPGGGIFLAVALLYMTRLLSGRRHVDERA